MPPKIYKALLLAVMVACLTGASLVQRSLVARRDDLGLTRFTELKGAPPLLTMTTVALGGFRGLISNILWIRANDLQQDDKYFEMVQLADWITKLEPHFTQVWLVQAWNMAYNISVKFKDQDDRWRWVQRGIELLRDQGLKYNPNDVLMHRELAWFFQHKMGANMDDAHMYYKQQWANEMATVFGKSTAQPDLDELIHPANADQEARARILRDTFKMDPVFMKKVDDLYGPLEWRLPEAHAIYWAAQGLEAARRNPAFVETNDYITLERVIYQSMQLSFQRGRLVSNKAAKRFEFAPNLAIIPKVSAAYEEAMGKDPKMLDNIRTAHRNFLRDAVYFLYTYNKQADAIKWFKYLVKEYPDKALIEGRPDSMPGTVSLDEFAFGRLQAEVSDMGSDKAKMIVEGLEAQAFESIIMDEDDHYVGLDHLAQQAYISFQSKMATTEASMGRVGLPPFVDLRADVLVGLLNGDLPAEAAAILRTKLHLSPDDYKLQNPEDSTPAGVTGQTNTVPDKPQAQPK
jgi:hypothetical protein